MATTRAHARPRTRSSFRIAIICALKVEADAVLEVLDPESTSWDSFGKAEGDNNTYTTGSINRHNIVVLYSGAGIPKTSAAAGHLFHSFPNISLVLVVGVCGGVPIAPNRRDIFLGDLVISSDAVHYTSKKQYPAGSARITRRDDELGKQQPEARNFVRKLELSKYQKDLQQNVQTELEKYHAVAPETFPLYPGTSHDILFASDLQHMHRGIGACENGACSTAGASVCLSARTTTCSELKCGSEEGAFVRCRESIAKELPAPSIHVGTFGTGDTVMKSGMDRDLIARTDGIDAFEMESAGVWDQRPTIVLKSVCDYADSHKNDEWHGYAAGVAAIGLKVLLQHKELPGVDLATESRDALSLKDALAYPRRDAKLELIREDHIPPNSFDWVWSRTPWKSWLRTLGRGEAPIFWISGLPGSGKSTLMESLAVDKRTTTYVKNANQSCKILRFFFDFRAGKDTANNRLGLLKLFIFELWHVYDANAPEGGKLEDRHARDPVDEMSEGRLVDLLSEMVNAISQRLLVFVDGLDEYEGDPHGLADFLQKLRRRTSMHLCLASRPEPVYERGFRDCPQLAMQDHNEASIRMYIDYAVERASSRLLNPATPINPDIRESIVSRAQGVMIWARLAVDQLLREDRVNSTPHALQQTIDKLPQKLESMYEQTLSRLPSAKAPEVALILFIILKLGRNARISDELLYGYFTFLSERCLEVCQDRQIISDQSEAKRLYLFKMKARVRTQCGALVITSLQMPELYAEGVWSQTDHGDLVTFKRSFRHPLSREPQHNPRWYATLFHRTFYEYLRDNQAILLSQAPRELLCQYPDAFQSRVHANVIAAATRDGDWDLKAKFSAVAEAVKEHPIRWRLHGSLKTLFDDIFKTKLSSGKPRYATIVDSMRQLPIAARTQETGITEPYEAWKEALASPIHFFTSNDDLDTFLKRSAEERVLRLAARWGLPRLFREVDIEITTSQALPMLKHQWQELFVLTWNECVMGPFGKLPREVPNGIKDEAFHKRRLRSYNDIFGLIVPHLVTFNFADFPQMINYLHNISESETDDSFLEADLAYRVLHSIRDLPPLIPSLTYPYDHHLSLELILSLNSGIGPRSVGGESNGLKKSRIDISVDISEVLVQGDNPYASYLSPVERLRLGSQLLILRLVTNAVALLSGAHAFAWSASWHQALFDSMCPPPRKKQESWQYRNQAARASLVLLFVLIKLGIEPGNLRGHVLHLAYRRSSGEMTSVEAQVSSIILFAFKGRVQSGEWPDYETITSRPKRKQGVDWALSHPLVRAIDDDGNVALETLDKYHQDLFDEGIIEIA